jgi:hypothetical protein
MGIVGNRFMVSGVAALLLSLGDSYAGSNALIVELSPAVRIDWTTGELTARAVGLADRRAPSPDVARAAARRRGIDDARVSLRNALPAIAWSDAKTLANEFSDAELDSIAGLAVVSKAAPQTDGGWQISLSLPLERIRQLRSGPRRLTDAGDDESSLLVRIDARSLTLRPSLALKVSGNSCALLWSTSATGAMIAAKAMPSNEITISS